METRASSKVVLGGTPVDLMGRGHALDLILRRAAHRGLRPLAVASVNLDHLHHFGAGGRWSGTMHADPGSAVEWVHLIDGAPLVSESQRLTGRHWPRLAGSDLAAPVLSGAEELGLAVGFLGGSEENQRLLALKIAAERPRLRVAGMWAPARSELATAAASERIAREIAGSGVQILFVGLGKPRQELWIDRYAALTGAGVVLAFGAAVDFLAGRVPRAPGWASRHGLEWGYRLALEPKRLAGRYLVDGPPAYLKLRTGSYTVPPNPPEAPARPEAPAPPVPAPRTPGRFTGPDGPADSAVIIVTHNNAGDVDELLQCLRAETADLALRVLLADNSSRDGTLEQVRARHPDVIAFATGGNLGYAAGINAALRRAGNAETIMILNPDLTVERGCLKAMLHRMVTSGAGAVVPRILDSTGATSPTLHREPGVSRALGDALLGRRAPGRPGWLASTDFHAESYTYAHTVEWASGAALMVSRAVADSVAWDESFFLYSEETDFFRRLREGGGKVWFEPSATVTHDGGGSGSSPGLNALMAVNRIRYVRKYHSPAYAAAFHGAAALSELLRCWKPDRKGVLRTVFDEESWPTLPGPSRDAADHAAFPPGSVIIPAHDEESVIARTLAPLAELAAAGQLEVIVACNGCSDNTARIARGFAGVAVLELDEASKAAALNAGDAAASRWPRLYLDADVQASPAAVWSVFAALNSGQVLAARPAARFELQDAHPLVRSYYRTRLRLPSARSGLWGGGAYGLSHEGRQRFGPFPGLTADDLFVDRIFEPAEKAVLDVDPVVVRPPRTPGGQIAVLHRVYRGNAEQNGRNSQNPAVRPGSGPSGRRGTAGRTLSEVALSVRGPVSAVHALVYVGFALAGRRGSGRPVVWERDATTRQPAAVTPR